MKPRKPPPEFVGLVAGACIAARVRLINRVITALYDEALRPFGVRVSQGNILTVVAYRGEARPSEISQILKIEKSTLSRDVDLMKGNGWLVSEPPEGGRHQVLRVTPQGMALLAKAQPAWQSAQDEATRLLGDAGVVALNRIAKRLGFGETATT